MRSRDFYAIGEFPINLMKVIKSNEELTGTDLEAKPGALSNMSQDKYYLHKYWHVKKTLIIIYKGYTF